jgi:hypothetical protein
MANNIVDGDGPSVLPAGVVTFLVADVDPALRGVAAAATAMQLHIAIDAATTAHGGRRSADHSVVAAFPSPDAALAAAADVARDQPAARLALHTGHARLRSDGRYIGATVSRGERLRDIGNGGQTLLSALTASLVDEELYDLGLHRLQDLLHPERVFELRPEAAGSLPLRSMDAIPNNLPLQLTSFVGRRDELDAVHGLLLGERLVMLAGPGGSGKTRLAAQVAAEQARHWRDGAWWVDLGAVADPGLVAEHAAAAVGALVDPTLGAVRSLSVQLADRRLLLCLDNC